MASIDDVVRRWQGYGDNEVRSWKVRFRWQCALQARGWCPVLLGVYDEEHGGVFSGAYMVDVGADRAVVELGWWLAPQARGRGLGRESLTLVLRYVHHHLGTPVAVMGTTRENERARGQIESTGASLVREGPHTLPNGEVVHGLWFEHREG